MLSIAAVELTEQEDSEEEKVKGSISDLMKQAQNMQADIQKAQEDLAKAEVRGEAGAGMVSVVMTGRHDVKSVSVDDSVLSEDKEVLEDLLAAAVNDAVRKVEARNKDTMSGLASGLDLPPGFKMPF
ncbi:MAG: YbaB/EbfC family nucleoid-associated protein [Halieaceae bacterium]|nr:YbaB/EbfC family nucleoid-associated protein [Halieaceae bacterium]